MRVLFVASEAHPFIKSGGLGDVAGALPKELARKGVDVRVVIPKYREINNELKNKLRFNKWFNVDVGWRNQYCGILEYEYDGVIYYFVDNEYYFSRGGMYGHYDDAERFAFFDRAVLDMIKQLDWKPNVIHCNDWQTGMIPVLLKLEYMRKDMFYWDIKSVFSIHNIAFQGVFDPVILPELFGYDYEQYTNTNLKFDDGVGFMKGAINYSDMITTVSYSYAEEIKTPEFGERLDWLLREKSYMLRGILNGIDYDEFNPKNDSLINKNYDVNNVNDKYENKRNLQSELGLSVNENIPMIAMVTRLTSQKGLDLLVHISERLLQNDIQLVIVGTGDKHYEDHFKWLDYKYGNKVSANIRFDNNLAHKAYAASDMFLMPSLFEPCGLGQLIALRYGSIPIVRETGGLKDTIRAYNEYTGEGNGFSFYNYNADELLHIIEYALKIYYDKNKWSNLVKNAMNSNNSWSKSADEYLNMYKELSYR
ncbi:MULTISPECIES: glycogen synthase GlgA [unclassified Clostridium]|uniref:glycogen synthase GlgA n=1 Tax=unclassified Clostridium TaxID=2614128 RepID=UPI001D3AD14E|nr:MULTISPECIES: glycogen synthase GlgA [unclassified Clostridium]MBN1046830.1 glycogen synthase GlgA [Clostridium botulinum]MBN1056721.1 glycogen synthase GlgA [Clostridium botulinum]